MDREQLVSSVQNLGGRGLRGGLSTLGDFSKFILRGNVVDLAVGIVIGAAFNNIVQELVKDLITPFIGVFGKFDFSTWSLAFNGSVFATGAFVNAIISFLITALVVYFFVVRPMNAMRDRFMPHKEAEKTARECPFCLSEVPLKATRCAFCTSQLPSADAPTAPGISQA